jgi:hypothetical protein
VMVPLCIPESDMELRTLAARHFGALKKAVATLTEYYTREQYTQQHSVLDPRVPYKCTYTSLETSAECSIKYISAIDGGKLMFTARTEDSSVVCIKFTRIYSLEAHKACASMGFAPVVRGFEEVLGGWYMIVMDYIGEEFHHMKKPSVALYESISNRITQLHQKGYVHGDLRSRNIMVRKDGTEGMMLFDFEWSGEIGQVRYPMNVGRGPGLERPAGAIDGELILADHDMEMLQIMFRIVL